MKKLHVSSVSILFAALCLAFTACNQGVTAGNGTGTVRVVIGGETARAVDAAGMPVFDEKNTTITVTGEDGTKLAEGTTSVTVEVGIGTKITVKAVVTTAAGVWRGSTEHTVTEGTNTVAVKLSKAPKSVGNILIDVNKDGNIANLKLASGASLVSNAVVNMIKPKRYPVTARDSIGRIYVLYEESVMSHAVFHFKRFDVEGKEDAGFESAITGKLPSGVTLDKIKTMVIDAKTNTVFVVADAGTNLYAYAVTETTHNTFTWSGAFNLLPPITSLHGIEAMAAYNNRLFLVVDVVDTTGNRHNKLFAYKVVLSATAFSLEQEGSGIELNKLRSYTGCTGLFADADGVYCLLSDQNLYGGNLYALGQIVRYQYSGSAFTGETKIGLNPKAAGTDGIPFDAQYFSAPVGFIGSDEDHIYIADDGVNIDTVNENLRVNGNKNRIAAFNRKTNEITFTDTAATWYEEKDGYQFPETKLLLWEKFYGSIKYWTSADGTEAFSPSNKLFEAASGKNPTDIFCYDQDGNLYILWKDGSDHKVRRFPLKKDGSYVDSAGVDLNNSLGSHPISAIAVDISGGQNYLYYTYENGPNTHIQRYNWNGTSFSTATQDPAYGVHISSSSDKIFFTALAANKDGVFVGVTETYKEGSIDKYRLKVQKYAKTGSLTAPDSEITLVDNAVSYTDVSDPPNPIADPGSPPNTACNQYQETINALQIGNGKLYGISSKLHRKWIFYNGSYFTDVFKHSSKLYEIGDTAANPLHHSPSFFKEKPAEARIGYGFYRFIAVKYDEAERIKCIIASDSAWGDDVAHQNGGNSDNIVEFNLKDMVFGEDKESGGTFSKTLSNSGFFWN